MGGQKSGSGETYFSPELVVFELAWHKSSQTSKQIHRAICQLGFQRNLSRVRHVNGGLKQNKGQLIWLGSCRFSKLRR